MKKTGRKITEEQRKAIYDRQGGACASCGKKLPIEELGIDHIKPLSDGGEATVENAQMVCQECNREKGTGEGKVMVSFRLDREIKTAVGEAAQKHGRTISNQFAQSLEDGLMLQELIERISDHLTETMEVNGKTFVHEPDEEECMRYIIAAAELVMDKENKEKAEAEKKEG